MSGQPYKYYTDIEKYRNEYLDSLNLQTNINDMNLQANKTYKETGALPAVSQMKDNRTTSEILADTEKLKIDIIHSLSKISNPQFASDVVQRIMNSPINQDNSLLIFTAQRINDISDKLTRIYTYGIKGDQNDAQQFVNFVISMYNDKNAIASSTKDFLNKYGSSNLGQYSGNQKGMFSDTYHLLSELSNTLSIMYSKITTELRYYNNIQEHDNITDTINDISNVSKIIQTIIGLLPNQDRLNYVNEIINKNTSSIDVYSNDIKTILLYKDYIDTSLPAVAPLNLVIKKLILNFNVLYAFIQNQPKDNHNLVSLFNQEQHKSLLINIENFKKSIINLIQVVLPSELFTLDKLNNLEIDINRVFENGVREEERVNVDSHDYMNILRLLQKQQYPFDNITLTKEESKKLNNEIDKIYRSTIPEKDKIRRYERLYNQIADENGIPKFDYDQLMGLIHNSDQGSIIEDEDVSDYDFDNESKSDIQQPIHYEMPNYPPPPIPQQPINDESKSETPNTIEDMGNSLNKLLYSRKMEPRQYEYYNDLILNDFMTTRNYDEAIKFYNALKTELNSFPSTMGNGIRKRGRPKGSGIQRKYADVVKRSIIDGKGIQEDMRFIKFGKYLINNKKLNDGILAVKRPSGNNILEFPSQRISKNMQSVIKTMVGGGMPKYEQFECLSEPEKAYLHKLSSKANILDKFSIPAPSKSQYEKDIHDFEVMKGEIMSGNDNKDLIKKFKLHIMKLSKMGSLPKHDVSDILETLIQLGY